MTDPGERAQVLWPIEIAPNLAGEVELAAALQPEGISKRQKLTVQPATVQVSLVARGPYKAGRPFWVSAVVRNPRDNQTATLTLPDGVSFATNHAPTKPVVTAARGVGQVSWMVVADTRVSGSRELAARLAPDGPEGRTTIEIIRGDLIH